VQSKNRNAFNFFAAYILSAFGYEFIFFTMTIYVYDLSKSALNVGIFAALTFFPRLFASFYGIIADRYSRVKVLSWIAGITCLLVISLVFCPNMAWIYLVWALISIFLTFIINVRTALMTEIMAQGKYLRGNSLVLILLNLAKICAPLLAGISVTVLGVKYLFVFTGAIYLFVVPFCARINLPVSRTVKSRGKIMTELIEGLKYIKDSLDLRFLITVAFLWRLFIGLQISLFVVYVKAHLLGGDTEYGMFMTIIGVGSILGSMGGPWLVKRMPYNAAVLWGLSIHYGFFIILGFLHDFHAALFVVFLSYVAFYATLVNLHSLRDQATRVDIRGRVYGSVTAILTPPAIISMLCGGYLANLFGVEKVFIGVGILAIITLWLLNLAKGISGAKATDISCF